MQRNGLYFLPRIVPDKYYIDMKNLLFFILLGLPLTLFSQEKAINEITISIVQEAYDSILSLEAANAACDFDKAAVLVDIVKQLHVEAKALNDLNYQFAQVTGHSRNETILEFFKPYQDARHDMVAFRADEYTTLLNEPAPCGAPRYEGRLFSMNFYTRVTRDTYKSMGNILQ